MDNKLVFDIEADELEIFMQEVNEHLQSLENGILLLEQDPDRDTLNSVFRAAHTIKALAGTVGHHRMAELTHTMETLFDAMREGELQPTQAVADDLFMTIDALKALRDEVITREASGTDITDLLARLRMIMEAENRHSEEANADNVEEVPAGRLNAKQIAHAEEFTRKGYTIFEATAATDPTGFAPAARLSQAGIAMLECGEIILQDPTMEELAKSKHNNKIEIILVSKLKREEIEKQLAGVFDLVSYKVQPYQTPSKTAQPKNGAVQSAKPGGGGPVAGVDLSADKTVRISVERLDSLMNLVGELVTDRNRLLQIEDNLLTAYGKEGAINDLGEMTAHVGRVVDQLQEEVMRARMLPIASTFNKMPRLVRDVSRSAGKQINLVIEGQETELDRSLIEFIGDPIIHLLRNAVDHGIESPQERLSIGKNPTGTVKLSAAHAEGHIVVMVQDDGGGINPEKVKRAAVKRNLITEEEAAQLSADEAIDLIFRPNLSTAEKVTGVSGRGVGMDVVRSNIERLSGSVVVESKVGVGTTFRITLPLTLAIVQTMLVSLKATTYAIPLSSIIESLYLSDVTVKTVKNNKVIHWRDSVLPLLDLREYFSHPRLKDKDVPSTKAAIVTVNWGKQRIGLVVDRIIGKQDIVVKSLNPIMGELPGLSGGTILGDGNIALIIDIPGLVTAALQARRQGSLT